MRSTITLAATEIADVLRDLPPDARLAALALAASETILSLSTASGGNADRCLTSFQDLVEDELYKACSRPAPPAKTFLDEVRKLCRKPSRGPSDRLSVIMETSGGFGVIMIVRRHVHRRLIRYRSQFYGSNDETEVWEMFGRDIMKPLGFSWPKFKR